LPEVEPPGESLGGERKEELGGKVVLTFGDGSREELREEDPITGEFVRTADRMMRPGKWKRLFGHGG
jgi:hypothetical protein